MRDREHFRESCLWHLQYFPARSLSLICERALFQKLANQPQGIHFLLQALEFGFFSAKHFNRILHHGLGSECLRTLYGRGAGQGTSPEYTPQNRNSVSQMVRMSFKDGERPIQLLQYHDSGEFMRQRHFSQAYHVVGLLSHRVAKAVRGPDREYKGDRISLLTCPKELCKFFRRQLFTSRIEQYQPSLSSASIAPAQLEQRGFIFERDTFDLGVLPQALQIIIRQ
jgi:hypothetical protein